MGKTSRRANRASRSARSAAATPVDDYPVITQVVNPNGGACATCRRAPRSQGALDTKGKVLTNIQCQIALANIRDDMSEGKASLRDLKALYLCGIGCGMFSPPPPGQGVLLTATKDTFTCRQVPAAPMERVMSMMERDMGESGGVPMYEAIVFE